MILVPASGREEPENEKMSELDQEMSAILKNPKLSTKEKVEMYNEVLRRNLIFEQRLLQKPIGNNDNNKIEMPISSNSNLLDTKKMMMMMMMMMHMEGIVDLRT